VKFIDCLSKCAQQSANYELSIMLRQTYDELNQRILVYSNDM
jgi:hypothetical protein